MREKSQSSPSEALERLFEVIRQEASANPTFARRMLDAVGAPVMFTGNDAAAAADPIVLAARTDYTAFREAFLTFTEAQLKKMLKGFGLATDEQVRNVTSRPRKDGYIDLLWNGAQRRHGERNTR